MRVLTDGYSFGTTDGITATKAQYEREMTNDFGTITLPFDAKSNETVQFYTVSDKTDNAIVLSEVETLTAGTPAIMMKKGDKVTVNAENVAVSNAINETNGTVTMHGSYTQDMKVTDANGYFISANKFYRRSNAETDPHFFCDAFRAYFTADDAATAGAKMYTISTGNNATGVNSIEEINNNGIEAVYNAAGVKQNGIKKGLNIVRLANGKNISVIIK